MLKRLFRASGLVLFVGSIALLGWWWVRIPNQAAARGGVRAALLDAVLFSVFALHHSVLARTSARRIVERVVPHDVVRSVYVWTASMLLAAVCLLWRPVGGEVYNVSGPTSALLSILQMTGLLIGILAVRRIDLRELAGLSTHAGADRLQYGGPYRFVRHPLYLGWVLIFFGAPHMTGDRLLFAAISTVYLLVAMPFEEVALGEHFGAAYLEYRRHVRWRLIPYIH